MYLNIPRLLERNHFYFLLKRCKKIKPLSLMLKGEWASSPDWSIDRTFICQFNFKITVKSPSPSVKTSRNPVYLASEYKEMIDTGLVKNQTELARIKGISRARVTQILNLLKLDKNILYELEQIGDPMDRKVISERELRKMINKN